MINTKISIITITLNSERFLEQTILSVAHQTYSNIEYIIIDGGSTDSTHEIIKKHEKSIDQWISEPDDGIADAMNKGLKNANGDYILFLHSDDYLIEPTVIERAVSYMDKQADIYLFQVILENDREKIISPASNLGWWTNFKMGSCHQGQLCSKKLYQRIGKFDTRFKISMDYDLILRAYRTGAESCSAQMPLSVMRLIGISSKKDWHSLKKRFDEERMAHDKSCPGNSMKLVYFCYWLLYLSYRRAFHLFKSNIQFKL